MTGEPRAPHDVAAVAEALPRPRRRALLLAAGTLWLPALLPLVLGMLADHGHCLQTYLLCLPIVPGVVFAVLLQLDGVAFALGGLVPTLAALVALYAAAREMPRRWLHGLQTVVIVLVALEAIGLAQLIRM